MINGYIRECQDNLFGDFAEENPYFNIPELINNHCILFYELLTWYKTKHGDSIEFISDTEVKLTGEHVDFKTCMLDTAISNGFCDKFDITFKAKDFGKENKIGFDIGYSFGESLESSIADWNEELGYGDNAAASKGFCFLVGSLYYVADGDDPAVTQLKPGP